ncbi:PPOX class F420-dependent oxidoreductase [Streptomyces justiciae]|uniref:PPOX class F420-dependent oxidoreductase n=1 Tax=Streptomyces justiciae TaxID=2780140 RepID=UPI00187DEE7D|nr:PPOX class F420-dependent oxidoreductase [Streptomyces justiciae]MBE8473846.1 PPOX class F420-dependent oxidoreductase [Streptomyces justiciae]
MTTSSALSSPSSSADGHPSLDGWVRALLDGKNYATVATIGRDGSPQNSVVWIKAEGDTVLFSSLDHRQKVRNLRRDPRISVSVYDLANPHTAVEIRGSAEIVPDEGKRLLAELWRKYLGVDLPAAKNDEDRVIIRVVPRKIIGVPGA